MSQPLVSIIIPAFNSERWVRETLESAFAQTWPAIEIILVNDGSTDKTLAIAREFEPRGLRIVCQENRGLSGARNTGIRVARGDFLQFLDADDLLSPDKIERQVVAAQRGGPNLLWLSPWARFKLDVTRARSSPSPLRHDFAPAEYLSLAFRINAVAPVHAWLVPRTISDRVGPFSEQLRVTEDVEFFTRAVLASDGVRYCAEGCSYYRSSHAVTLSRFRERPAFESLLAGARLIEATVAQSPLARELRPACADYYQHLALRLPGRFDDLRRIAKSRVAALGGSAVRPVFGRRGSALARFIGWRAVQWLRVRLWSWGIHPGKADFISE